METYLQKAAEWTVAANHNGDHDLDDDGNHDDTKADNATLPQQMKKNVMVILVLVIIFLPLDFLLQMISLNVFSSSHGSKAASANDTYIGGVPGGCSRDSNATLTCDFCIWMFGSLNAILPRYQCLCQAA